MLLASTALGARSADGAQDDVQRRTRALASVLTPPKPIPSSRPAKTAVETLPSRIRSLLRQRGAGATSQSVSQSAVHAVPITDAAFAEDAAAAINGPLTEPSQNQPTLTHSPAHNPTWCPCCGHPQTDPMTGLMDRWMWTQRATMLLDRFGSEHDPITLLMADLDRFKVINDSVGHIAGDAVLAAVADVIRSETRSGDLWGRYGSYAGDEFVGLLPGASLPAAVSVAERLQSRVAAMCVPVATSTGTTGEISDLSISIGLATHTPGRSLDDTVGRADMALLTAKRSGRDCVCVVDARSHVVVARRGDHGRPNERSHREQAC
jgi:diguanylate cyclase (GGDEF)-like protein